MGHSRSGDRLKKKQKTTKKQARIAEQRAKAAEAPAK